MLLSRAREWSQTATEKLVVTLSAPVFDPISQTLTFSASRVGEILPSEELVVSGKRLENVEVFIDNFGSIFLIFGAQVI